MAEGGRVVQKWLVPSRLSLRLLLQCYIYAAETVFIRCF